MQNEIPRSGPDEMPKLLLFEEGIIILDGVLLDVSIGSCNESGWSCEPFFWQTLGRWGSLVADQRWTGVTSLGRL